MLMDIKEYLKTTLVLLLAPPQPIQTGDTTLHCLLSDHVSLNKCWKPILRPPYLNLKSASHGHVYVYCVYSVLHIPQ